LLLFLRLWYDETTEMGGSIARMVDMALILMIMALKVASDALSDHL
jgi:hypothetical protein